MEKIYMQENQNQKNNKNRRSLLSSTSIMMSFILAFVAIVSIAAYAFGQTSFAIPAESHTPFPDSITTGTESDESEVVLGSLNQTFQVRLHQATINDHLDYVICIEKDVDIDGSSQYNRDAEIKDAGLLFLLNYLLSSDTQVVNDKGSAVDKKAKGWIAQTLIWVYQKEVGAANNAKLTQDEINKIKNEVKIYLKTDALASNPILQTTSPIYDVCKVKHTDLGNDGLTINQMLTKAKAIHDGTDSWYAFTLDINKKTDKISITEDGKYYQSDLITVTGSKTLVGFKLDLSKAPTGTIAVKPDGSEMSGSALDNLTTGTQFYIRVPKDKITEDNKKVSISVTGAFTGDMAYQYVKEGSQKIAYTGKVTKQIQSGLDIEFNYTPDVPDTALNAAQSIYFIGLIILLTGVGIIYANIKPSKAQQ